MTLLRTPLLLIPLCLAAFIARSQQGGDLEAQILYAFHAEDSNELASLVQLLSTQEAAGSTDVAHRYHLAHAEFRLGLVAGDKRGHNAEAAFVACVDELKPVLRTEVNSAESLALQGACYASLAALRKIERPLLRARADDRLDSASKLEPRNPRVLYLTAVNALSRYKPGTLENQRAFAKLQLAVQLFDQASATDVAAPAWGHAEAFLEMGRQVEARGDVLGARNWIEKSLIVAPDFKAARRQLATLVRR